MIAFGLGVFAVVAITGGAAEIRRRRGEAEGRADDPNDPEEPRRG